MRGEKGSFMLLKELVSSLSTGASTLIPGAGKGAVSVYSRSIRMLAEELFFIGREKSGKYFYAVSEKGKSSSLAPFQGESLPAGSFGGDFIARRCPLNRDNAVLLREKFSFTRPVLIGVEDSFGFGDRLGIANPAHLRALSGSHMRPVLAQQSVRELDRTDRTAADVMDAASWAAFQEGYTAGFGADADHLKTTADIDRYALAGFTMYTFDPSAHVVNEALTLGGEALRARAKTIEQGDLMLDETLARYRGRSFRLEEGIMLSPGEEEIIRAFVKYGGVILHARELYRHLKTRHAELPSEVELSVDETDVPTTPTEHLFVGAELKRLGVSLVSLAPRFIGDFEKGVDYRGDLDLFAAEYRRHVAVAKLSGPYKISVHSGSDKFGVYRMIGSMRQGKVHVKTAGTSYLEALRTVAMTEPALLREILSFSRERYDTERQSYHVTATLDRVPRAEDCKDGELAGLFNEHDARQVLHVTFGKVLTSLDGSGRPLFRGRIMECLDRHEDVHYENIIRHFRKHLDPFRARGR